MAKDIKTLSKSFKNSAVVEKEMIMLKDENAALKATLNKLLKKLDELQDVNPDLIISKGYTPEQEIIEIQIERLQAVSRQRTLSLDETRTLDLHLKNKRVIDKDLKDALEAEWKDLSIDDLTEIIEDEPKIKQIPKRKAKKAKTS